MQTNTQSRDKLQITPGQTHWRSSKYERATTLKLGSQSKILLPCCIFPAEHPKRVDLIHVRATRQDGFSGCDRAIERHLSWCINIMHYEGWIDGAILVNSVIGTSESLKYVTLNMAPCGRSCRCPWEPAGVIRQTRDKNLRRTFLMMEWMNSEQIHARNYFVRTFLI